VNNGLKMTWTETIIVTSQVLLWHLPRGPVEHHQKPQDTNCGHVHQDTGNSSA